MSTYNIAKQLKKGDYFIEEDYGTRILCKVTSDIVEENDQVKWTAKVVESDENYNLSKKVDYLITRGYEHYGPKIRPHGETLDG